MDGLPSVIAKVKISTPNSTLLNLPPEILRTILYLISDKISILVLRQTCRQLRFLCEGTDLVKANFAITPPFQDPKLGLSGDEIMTYCQLLWKDQMCGDCAELRSDSSLYKQAVERIYERVWCSGCRNEHPAFLFSLKERQKEDDSSRFCIGRQAYFRLCKHHTIRWRHFEHYSVDPPVYSSSIRDCDVCRQKLGRYNSSDLEDDWVNVCYVCTYKPGVQDQFLSVQRCFLLDGVNPIKKPSDCIVSAQELNPPLRACNHVSHVGYNFKRASSAVNWSEDRGYGTGTCIMPHCKLATIVERVGRHIRVSNDDTISTTSPVDPAWLDALDPQSYLSDNDELTRGLMWCRDPSCGITRLGRARYFLFHQQDWPYDEEEDSRCEEDESFSD
ncbi:F-box domain cyclin [Apiospora arundinis]|uniref:F-box domain cyclin n=1 Tax=Apiospora arundinis TaxID=335852 RepID=A0ABR2HZL5_9PEZI